MRALVAWFWETPYRESPVRWGTELHDRFSLPHFVQQDFDDVLGDLARAGFRFERDWFAPHHEFRFPLAGVASKPGTGSTSSCGRPSSPGTCSAKRPAAAATCATSIRRSSALEVKVRGMTDARHVIACNGRRVPLHPTGTDGEFVAGVRYRAWQPPSALHPTIGVHAPLVFDLFDRWNDRAVGGCTYHVPTPAGSPTRPSRATPRGREPPRGALLPRSGTRRA